MIMCTEVTCIYTYMYMYIYMHYIMCMGYYYMHHNMVGKRTCSTV